MDVAGVVVARGDGLESADGPSIGDPSSSIPSARAACATVGAPVVSRTASISAPSAGPARRFRRARGDTGRPMSSDTERDVVRRGCLPAGAVHDRLARARHGRARAARRDRAGERRGRRRIDRGGAVRRGRGATVIGTAGGPTKVAKALELGCTHAVDHYGDGMSPSRAGCHRRRGVDLVIDHVGPALFEASIRSLAIEGRMVFCGTTTGTRVEVDLPSVYHWGRTLIGAGGYRPAEFAEMLAAVASYELRPVVDSVWRFDVSPRPRRSWSRARSSARSSVTFGDIGVTPLRQRLTAGEPLVGVVVRTPSHHVVEVLAASSSNRPDLVVLDAEHAPSTSRVSMPRSRWHTRSGSLPSCGSPSWPGRRSSRRSISVPRGSSCRVLVGRRRPRVVRLAHYGDGGRGFSPSTRSAGWGSRPIGQVLDDAAARRSWWCRSRTPAVAAIDEIVAVAGVECRRSSRSRRGARRPRTTATTSARSPPSSASPRSCRRGVRWPSAWSSSSSDVGRRGGLPRAGQRP